MSLKILIVDDSATTRALIKRTIQLAKLPVEKLFEAADGKAGLAQINANPVDLVLADLHMPEMDGAEMTRQILKNPATANTPVVIISAEPNNERIAQLQLEGVKGYLRKPFTPESLREVINQVLGVAHA